MYIYIYAIQKSRYQKKLRVGLTLSDKKFSLRMKQCIVRSKTRKYD